VMVPVRFVWRRISTHLIGRGNWSPEIVDRK
jgi:hypothetical protein